MSTRAISTTLPRRDDAAQAAPAPTVAENRLFLPMIMVAVFVSVFTGSMVNVLLPGIQDEFGITTAQASWIITGYSLVYAVGIPLYGKLADAIGIRRILTTGLVVFAAGCLMTMLSPGIGGVIAGRIVQGFGGAAVASLSLVAVATMIPVERRGAAMGMVGSMIGLGSAAGPIVGGNMAGWIGWRSLFLVPMILLLALFPVARRVLPAPVTTAERRVDLPGGLLLAVASGGLLFGITQGQSRGFGDSSAWGSFAVAVMAGGLFGAHIRRARHPFVPPALLGNRAYVLTVLTGFSGGMAFLGSMVFLPLMLVNENGLSTGRAGLVLTPGAIALALLAPRAGSLTDRIGPRIPLVAGMAIFVTGALYLATIGAGYSAWVIAIGAVTCSAGYAFVGSPLNKLAASTLAPEVAGVGMGVFAGIGFLGGGAGAALFGALLDWRLASGGGAFNPLYGGDAPAYADTYLAIAGAMLVALVAALAIPATAERP